MIASGAVDQDGDRPPGFLDLLLGGHQTAGFEDIGGNAQSGSTGGVDLFGDRVGRLLSQIKDGNSGASTITKIKLTRTNEPTSIHPDLGTWMGRLLCVWYTEKTASAISPINISTGGADCQNELCGFPNRASKATINPGISRRTIPSEGKLQTANQRSTTRPTMTMANAMYTGIKSFCTTAC